MHYLRGTLHMSLLFSMPLLIFHAYSDTNWMDNVTDKKIYYC